MSEKPKRKNSPNRRRKFLLVLILFALLVSGGIAVLSPQIEAWLATDPFTPQCHFEEDRLFITNEPLELHSINNGFIREFPTLNKFSDTTWSLDGQHFVSSWYDSENSNRGADVISAQGEKVGSVSWEAGLIMWSPDNRHFSYVDSFYWRIFDIETNQESEDGFWFEDVLRFGWSPNGRYLPMSTENEWIIVNAVDESHYWFGSLGRFIGWSQDSRFIYFAKDDTLKQLDTGIWKVTDLLELPYPTRYDWNMLSPDRQTIIFYDETNSGVYVDLNTFELKTFGNATDAYNLGWTPDSRYFVYGELKNEDFYDSIQVYDTVANTTRQLKIPINIGRYDSALSPSGRYISYVREYKLDGETPLNYGIYDLETDTEHIITESYKNKYSQKWFSNMGKDYFLIPKPVGTDNQRILTIITDMEDFSTCKIGALTQYSLKFQPQG